ncbi:MAG: hypothetical protein AB8H86_14315 [Polyangiales bacterium]
MSSAKNETITVFSHEDGCVVEVGIEDAPKRGDEASGVVPQSKLEIVAFDDDPDESALESISAVLALYPEVESAAFAMAQRGTSPPEPLVSICVHREYRGRTVEILDLVRQASAAAGLEAGVLLLQDSQVPAIRKNALVFFPWRRKKSSR